MHRRRPHLLALVLAAPPVALLLAVAGCSSDKAGSKAAFCREVKQVPPLAEVLSGYRTDDEATLATKLDRASEQYGDLAAAAPKAIADDTRAVTDLVQAVVATLEGGRSTDPTAVARRIRAVVADHPGVTPAARRVARYADDECGVQLNPR